MVEDICLCKVLVIFSCPFQKNKSYYQTAKHPRSPEKQRKNRREKKLFSLHAFTHSFFQMSVNTYLLNASCVMYLSIGLRQKNKYLCPCEADILATHSSHLSQCIGTKPPLGRPMGPPSLVTPTLLPFRIYCHFLFCLGSQLAGLMPLFICLFFFSSMEQNVESSFSFFRCLQTKHSKANKHFHYCWSRLPPSLSSVYP